MDCLLYISDIGWFLKHRMRQSWQTYGHIAGMTMKQLKCSVVSQREWGFGGDCRRLPVWKDQKRSRRRPGKWEQVIQLPWAKADLWKVLNWERVWEFTNALNLLMLGRGDGGSNGERLVADRGHVCMSLNERQIILKWILTALGVSEDFLARVCLNEI